jgi:hypothetical protein
LFIKAASGLNRINVLGVADAIIKEVITYCNTTCIGAETIVAFFKQLKEHYRNLPLKIVLDIDIHPDKSTPAIGHDLNTIDFLYRTLTITDVDIYRLSPLRKVRSTGS